MGRGEILGVEVFLIEQGRRIIGGFADRGLGAAGQIGPQLMHQLVVVFLHSVHAPGDGAQRVFQRGGGIIGFQPADQRTQSALDAVQAAFLRRVGRGRFQPLQAFFQPADGAVGFGVAPLQFGLVAGANPRLGFQTFQRMIQRIGIEVRGFFDRRQPLIQHTRCLGLEGGEAGAGIFFDRRNASFQAAGAAFDFVAHLAQASGHLFEIARHHGGLLRRLGRGLGDLVGQAR